MVKPTSKDGDTIGRASLQRWSAILPHISTWKLDYLEVKVPVKVGDRSVETKEARCHLRICVWGSNSQFPPPTKPSAASSFPIWVCKGRLSPEALALTDVAPLPRKMDTFISSRGRVLRRDDRVSVKRPWQIIVNFKQRYFNHLAYHHNPQSWVQFSAV